MKKITSAVICLTLLALSGVSIAASNDDLSKRFEELEKRMNKFEQTTTEHIEEHDKKISTFDSKLTQIDGEILHRQKGVQSIEFAGIQMSVGGTFVLQGAHNINSATSDGRNAISPSFSADVAFERKIEQIGADMFLHLEGGQGTGVENDLVVFSNVNRDADDDLNVRLTELWYEQTLFSERLAITFGKLDPTVYFDTNDAANDETTQFLARIFRNNPAIAFPDNTFGARIAILPAEWFEASYGVFDANADWRDVDGKLFHAGQVEFKPNLFGKHGHYRFMVWANTSDHTKWNNPASTNNTTYGLALSFDQKIIDELTLFARYGWQNPNLYNPTVTTVDGDNFSIAQSWSGGLSLSGALWGRENDTLAAAVGQVIPSSGYKNATGLNAKNEEHVELYYNIYINKHLALTPEFQMVVHPFGGDAAKNRGTVYVGGLRAQLDF